MQLENNPEDKQKVLEKCYQQFGELKKHLSDNLLILPTYEIAQAQKVNNLNIV